MKNLIFFLYCSVNLYSQNSITKESLNTSNIEAGTFVSFNPYKKVSNPGVFVGYWYTYPLDDTKTILEIGGDFNYSNSVYSFQYGINDQFYDILSNEYFFNIGGRMVKKVNFGKYEIDWVSELAFHNLFFDGKNVPDDEPRKNEENSKVVYIDAESISSLKLSQGFRIWRNHLGFGISLSYFPYRLWYKNTVPKNFTTFSIETGVNFRF